MIIVRLCLCGTEFFVELSFVDWRVCYVFGVARDFWACCVALCMRVVCWWVVVVWCYRCARLLVGGVELMRIVLCGFSVPVLCGWTIATSCAMCCVMCVFRCVVICY